MIKTIKNGIIKENPTFVQVLGMCPTLAVTTSLANGIGMGLSVTFVLTLSNMLVSMLRKLIPSKIRIAAYVVIIATFVTIVVIITFVLYLPSISLTISLPIPNTLKSTKTYHNEWIVSVLKRGTILNGSVVIMQITCGAIKNTQRNTTEITMPTIESALEIFAFFFGTGGKSSRLPEEVILTPFW